MIVSHITSCLMIVLRREQISILKGLANMYAGSGSMTENIDKAAGKGTVEFVAKAVQVYCD